MNKLIKTPREPKNLSARRSQRRINKLLEKNISQYQIPNPFRNIRNHSCLPHNLNKQLSKLDYLSVRNLQSLHFKDPILQEQVNQLLLKMRCAIQKQSEQFNSYLNSMALKMRKQTEATICEEEDKNKNEGQPALLEHNSNEAQHSISLQIEIEEQGNLPMVHRQSEGVSMMSDNYESDKLAFHTYGHLHMVNQAQYIQQSSQSFQL